MSSFTVPVAFLCPFPALSTTRIGFERSTEFLQGCDSAGRQLRLIEPQAVDPNWPDSQGLAGVNVGNDIIADVNAAGGRLARAPAGLKKDPRIGLAKADVLGKHHHREIPVQTCPLELSHLLFAGAIRDDPQGLISQLFQAWSGILEGGGPGLVRANEYLIARIGFGVGEIGTAKNIAHAL